MSAFPIFMERTCFVDLTRLLFVHCLLSCFVLSAANYTTDQSALLAFKSHITNDPDGILASNWTTTTSICSWIGVTCSPRQRVRALNLSGMGLRGTLPPHLGNLSFLARFNIINNEFHDRIPDELFMLHRLEVVDFRSNNFGGDIPSSVFNASSLQWISFANNSLTGTLPDNLCRGLPNLTALYLIWNALTGRIPSILGECRVLRFFSLFGNQMTGSIPRAIGNLTMLEGLYLGANNLGGGIPQEIGNLQSLKIVVIERAGLTGSIPSSIFNISSLTEIYLGGNNISFLPVDMCLRSRGLAVLAVWRNKVMGNIPRAVGNCTSLIALDLSDNKLSGEIPLEISNAQSLQNLRLSFNNLTGPLPETIFNISQLQYITLGGNHLSGNLPSNIGLRLPNLVGLLLAGNNLGGIIPDSISNVSKLQDIDLTSNKFTGSIPHSLGNLEFLGRLYLTGNNFVGESSSSELSFLTSLTKCRNLRELWVASNPLSGILPPTIGNFSSSMAVIQARSCEIKGNIPSEIGNLTGLIFLSLSSNNLTGFVPMTVKGLTQLQQLYLYGNRFQGSILVDLCYLKDLGNLDLSQTGLSGLLPACLGNITSLRYLNLSMNSLTSSIPKSMGNINDLLQLDLSSNFLSGNLPLELGSLKAALLIDLSMNQFSGEIPSTIGGIQTLTNLSLAYNRLNGSIPQSFDGLISLESLDLSHNTLTDVIPKSLEALTHLKYFNVSFNRLRGEIPSGGPFANFTNQSFMKNEALCGAPWLHMPLCNPGSLHRSRKRKLLLLAYILSPIACILFATAVALAIIRCRRRKEIPAPIDMSPAITHQRISYLELVRATSVFSESNLLGSGSFSSVYKGALQAGTIIAVKVFDLQLEGAFRSFDTECEILRNLRHRNLVKVISSCSTPDFKGLVLEYIPNGTLEEWLYSHNHFLDILKRLEIMIDVACALEYLHHGYSMRVVHCDLKPRNVLLDDNMVARVSDFGIAKFLCTGESIAQTTRIGTLGYIAPEYGMEGLVSTKCDVYSYGIMLMETFTRKKPTDRIFDGDLSLKRWINDSLPHAIPKVMDANLLGANEEQQYYDAKVQCVSSIMEVAVRCSSESPEERMNMKDVLAAIQKTRLQYLANCIQK